MNPVRNGIIGVAIGDMLGVPVEGFRQEVLTDDPVLHPREYGRHNQPKGTWSDDTSLTLCLADSLTRGYNLEDIAKTFLRWKIAGDWTPYGLAFDIGNQTNDALNDLYRIFESGDIESLEHLHYEAREDTNGNGSLMRILPLYFYLQHEKLEKHFDTIWAVSALTHPHVRSALACLMYLIMLKEMEKQDSLHNAYLRTAKRMRIFINKNYQEEKEHFGRLLDADIQKLPLTELRSGGYVIETLEASFWSLLNTESYTDAVLQAINLGYDTDTTGAVTGGLAGMFYGIDTAPVEWYKTVARIKDIEVLSDKLYKKYPSKPYKPSPVIRFLLGKGKDSKGRTLEDVLNFDDARLENEHDYIQWLFPLREQSTAVWDAPTLTNSDIAFVSQNEDIRANLVDALIRMGEFFRVNDHWLVPHDHNHLRITRILKSTYTLLGKEHAETYYDFIMHQIDSKNVQIKPKNLAFWNTVIGK